MKFANLDRVLSLHAKLVGLAATIDAMHEGRGFDVRIGCSSADEELRDLARGPILGELARRRAGILMELAELGVTF